MSAQLHISEVDTAARFAGDMADEPAIRRRLEALVSGPVAGGVADALMGAERDDAPLMRIGELKVRLALTRAELDSGVGADQWLAAILEALAQADVNGAVCRFDSELAYLAAYVHHRIGVSATPAAVFSDFPTLDLLSPLRATAELLRATPGLWSILSPKNGLSAVQIITALRALNGEAGLAILLQGGEDAAGAQAAPTSIPAMIDLMPERLTGSHWPDSPIWAALHPNARCVLATLLLSDLSDTDPVAIGRLGAVLSELAAGVFPTNINSFLSVLRKLGLDKPAYKLCTLPLQSALKSDPELFRKLTALILSLRDTAPAAPTDPSTDVEETGAQTDGRTSEPKVSKTAEAADNKPKLSHFQAPFAGVGLILTHLLEEGIGSAFPADLRAAALASLVTNDKMDVPQTHPFIAALCGADNVVDLPDRPTQSDMLFVASARHDSVMLAPPGAPRLAAWLAARFASALPGLTKSSLGFLQRQFLQMPGEVWIDPEHVTLRVDPMPLLPVLQLSGRLGDSDPPMIPWLKGRKLILRVDAGGAP